LKNSFIIQCKPKFNIYLSRPRGKPFFCPMDKKIISPQIKLCIVTYLGLCKFIWKTSKCYRNLCFIMQLFRIWDTSFLPFFMLQTVVWWLQEDAVMNTFNQFHFGIYISFRVFPHFYFGHVHKY